MPGGPSDWINAEVRTREEASILGRSRRIIELLNRLRGFQTKEQEWYYGLSTITCRVTNCHQGPGALTDPAAVVSIGRHGARRSPHDARQHARAGRATVGRVLPQRCRPPY